MSCVLASAFILILTTASRLPAAGTPEVRPVDVLEVNEKQWFDHDHLRLPWFNLESVPAGTLRTFQVGPLVQALYDAGATLLLYGKNYAGARYVVAQGPRTGAFRYAFGFASLLTIPGVKADDLTEEPVAWAVEDGGVLCASNGHRTYAGSSKGRNSYLTAIDVKTGKIFWRSRPLIATCPATGSQGTYRYGHGLTKDRILFV
jgi:hypothetical protein